MGLSAIGAAAAAVGCFPLLAVLVHVTDEHPAAHAGVGALVLVVVVGCCVEGFAGWRYSVLVHRVPPVGPRLGGLGDPAGASYVVNTRIVSHLTLLCNCFALTISENVSKMHLHSV